MVYMLIGVRSSVTHLELRFILFVSYSRVNRFKKIPDSLEQYTVTQLAYTVKVTLPYAADNCTVRCKLC